MRISLSRSGIKAIAFLCAFFAVIFIVFGGLQYGYSGRNIIFFGVTGIILGAIGAPVLEPKAFRYPTLWHIFFSIGGCLLLAFATHAPPEGYGLGVATGLLLGYFAPYWIKHIQVP